MKNTFCRCQESVMGKIKTKSLNDWTRAPLFYFKNFISNNVILFVRFGVLFLHIPRVRRLNIQFPDYPFLVIGNLLLNVDWTIQNG